MFLSTLLAAATLHTLPQPPASAGESPAIDWRTAEAPFLTRHVQLTSADRFVKAGEQYFDHHTPPRWVVFQAGERPAEGKEPDPNYAMFVSKLKRDSAGQVTGIEEPIRISPPGSANTCGWFHPTDVGSVLLGSTLKPPAPGESPGYSRDRQRYSWQFPPEMEVVIAGVRPMIADDAATSAELRKSLASMEAICGPHEVFTRPGYDAECSFSKDGRFLLYTHVDPETSDPDIWLFDTRTQKQHPIIEAKGYDGGPFFSPDGKWICYRSDRKGNNVLQLYIAELALGNGEDAGVPTGVKREIQLTTEDPAKPEKEQAVSWCPYWHPSAKYMVYATSEMGHSNYEVFAIEVDPSKAPAGARKARVTHAPGFDGLPAFSDDGKLMMWTSQRGSKRTGEERPSSQMWIAEVEGEPVWPTK
jgi:TolB protein